jgi:enoyl-CoA hydratase/carnithine racemase
MKAEYLLLDVDTHVATVTINRPEKGNSLTPDVLDEIEEMFSGLSSREDVRYPVRLRTGEVRAARDGNVRLGLSEGYKAVDTQSHGFGPG